MFARLLRSSIIFSSLCWLAVVLPPMPAQATTVHSIPYGTPIPVRLDEPLSSYHLREGMGIPVRVTENIVVDGDVVIRRGAFGVAQVIESNGAAVSEQVGSFMLRLIWVRAVDHSRIGVDGYLVRSGDARQSQQAGAALEDAGSNIVMTGAVNTGITIESIGGVVSGVASLQKGGEATAARGEVIYGHVANIWGVTIASDIPAPPGSDDSPIK